jgi:hypothetical protein
MLTPLRSFTFRHVGSAIGAAVAHLSTLPHDSRETLVSKDTQGASFGISWSTDIVYETELARELQAAHERRLAKLTPGPVLGMAG